MANVIKITDNTGVSHIKFTGGGAANVISSYAVSSSILFSGGGGANVITRKGKTGHLLFKGGGIANVINWDVEEGNVCFSGGGGANVITAKGVKGDLAFMGVGLANVLVHSTHSGDMYVIAGGAANVLVRIGNGKYMALLAALGNISVHQGDGASMLIMLGGLNTHTQIGHGNALWLVAGGANVLTHKGSGDVVTLLAGGINVMSKMGNGDLMVATFGGANIITQISDDDIGGDTWAIAFGGLNIITRQGKGDVGVFAAGGANVLTHVGKGETVAVMLGGANILTKVGEGDTAGVMLGLGNVMTQVGNGEALAIMAGAGNILTKVGNGDVIGIMLGAGNLFTHVGVGNNWALMAAVGNIFTKVGFGDVVALMVAKGNIFTQVGNGNVTALMLAKGNIFTKVGEGSALAAMVGGANIMTHIGNDTTFAAMLDKANILTKVGYGTTMALMLGKANIYTHVTVDSGVRYSMDGGRTTVPMTSTSIGLFAGDLNVMTKVGEGMALAAMFGKANIMTHIGNGLTGALLLGKANIVTKVGDGFMGVLAKADANIVTHVGNGLTAALLYGKANIVTKVGDGFMGVLAKADANIVTHIGKGTTAALLYGNANIITKVGDGLGINAAWGKANLFTHVGQGDRYNFAKGQANIITKVGAGREVSVVQGKANIITHIGAGDNYTGAWGDANVITQVGAGQAVVLAKGKANVITLVGNGDSYQGLWGDANIVTKVGNGSRVIIAKGKANISTAVGDGLSVVATYGDTNINTKVGDGLSVNLAWGKHNLNTTVGHGLNVAVMKGAANANIHVGNGLGIMAAYARNNVAVKIGNGDFYSLAVASSNTQSNKLATLFGNIKQNLLGRAGSQAINALVQGNDGQSSGFRAGRGEIKLTKTDKLTGFTLDDKNNATPDLAAVARSGADLATQLAGKVTQVATPDLSGTEADLLKQLEMPEEKSTPEVTNPTTTQEISKAPVDTINPGSAETEPEQQVGSQFSAIGEAMAQGEEEASVSLDNAEEDKKSADADRKRLQQEEDRQLAAIKGTQSQLESTDQTALATNGTEQKIMIQQEADQITAELMLTTKDLDSIGVVAEYQGASGEHWKTGFAAGVTEGVQNSLNKAKKKANAKLKQAESKLNKNGRPKVATAVARAESAVAKGEQDKTQAEQRITDTKSATEQRKQQASSQQTKATLAKDKAQTDASAALARGNKDATAAADKAGKAATDAKSVQQKADNKPVRSGAAGSGLSGKAYQTDAPDVPDDVEVNEIEAEAHPVGAADKRFSAGLTATEQQALKDGKAAVNQLQTNAAQRQGKKTAQEKISLDSLFATPSATGSAVPEARLAEVAVKTGESDKVSSGNNGSDNAPDRQAARISGVNGLDQSDKFLASQHLGGSVRRSTPVDLSDHLNSNIATKDQLLRDAAVTGKTRGNSYLAILASVDKLHATSGTEQIETAFILQNQLRDYQEKNPGSGRNKAFEQLSQQIDKALFSADMSAGKASINRIAQKQPAQAAGLYQAAFNEAEAPIRALTDGTKVPAGTTQDTAQANVVTLQRLQQPVDQQRKSQELADGKAADDAVTSAATLSKAQIDGIRWYTSVGYDYVNRSLRDGSELQYFVKDYGMDALTGLDQLEKYRGTLYRALYVEDLPALEGKLHPGKLVSDHGFLSTSSSAEFTKDLRGGKGTVIYAIEGVTDGHNIAGYAQLPQAEVLLAPGSHLRVKATKLTGQNLYVLLEPAKEFTPGEVIRNIATGEISGQAVSRNSSTVMQEVKASFGDIAANKILNKKWGASFDDTDANNPNAKQGTAGSDGDTVMDKVARIFFNPKAKGEENPELSFHFSQSSTLLNALTGLMQEIGEVRFTKGDKKAAREFREGLCLALSARYLMEERKHGAGGGKAYMSWLQEATRAYLDNKPITGTGSATETERQIRSRYHRQQLTPAIADLMSLQDSQNNLDGVDVMVQSDKAKAQYDDLLRKNGLNVTTTVGFKSAVQTSANRGYEATMDGLRTVDNNTYIAFGSKNHAMAVVVNRHEGKQVWTFFDPNMGAKFFDNYDSFRRFMDNMHKSPWVRILYKYSSSTEAGQSFTVDAHQFAEVEITEPDSPWKNARDGEQRYLLRALQEQGIRFKLDNAVTGQVTDYAFGEDSTGAERITSVTVKLIDKTGKVITVEVPATDFDQAQKTVTSHLSTLLSHKNGENLSIDTKARVPVVRKSQAVTFGGEDVLSWVEPLTKRWFNSTAKGQENPELSFNFSQSKELLIPLTESMREIGKVRFTKGDKKAAQEFREGLCLALSARYLMEERKHGAGGGKAYISWLQEATHAYLDKKPITDTGSATETERQIRNRYHRQQLAPAIADLMSLQDSQSRQSHAGAKGQYDEVLKANGLDKTSKDNKSAAKDVLPRGYETFMDWLKTRNENTYYSIKSGNHAMAVLVNQYEGKRIWTFFDPNLGAKSFDNYDNFRTFMGNLHSSLFFKFYKYPSAGKKAESERFLVGLNQFSETEVTHSESIWKSARDGEQRYLLRALQEQGIRFKLDNAVTGQVTDYAFGEDSTGAERITSVTVKLTDNTGKVITVEVLATDFDQAQKTVTSHLSTLLSHKNGENLRIDLNAPTPVVRQVLSDNGTAEIKNRQVNSWARPPQVEATQDGGTTRYDGQIIIQTEDDPIVARAAAKLAGKHANSVLVQLDAEGNYRVINGDPSRLSGNLRWQVVGHGRGNSGVANNLTLAGQTPAALADTLKKFNDKFSAEHKINSTPGYVSLVGCSLTSQNKEQGFAQDFIHKLDKTGIRADVAARRADVIIDQQGRKVISDSQGNLLRKVSEEKVVLRWNEQGTVESSTETVRNNIAESDINIARVGTAEAGKPVKGAIADNAEIFTAPKKRPATENAAPAAGNSNPFSYAGNVQVNVGDGEFTTVNWGTSNVGVKVGTGGFKALVFGDNNAMVHIGNGDSKHSVSIGGYQAFEGAQLFIGQRNVSFNLGRSNDLIIMSEKSIPNPPLVNPFGGAARIAGVLQHIAAKGDNGLQMQDQQWSVEGAKKFVTDMSGLDQTSSVDYKTLTDINSQSLRSSLGLKSDLEATLNKKYNQWLGSNGQASSDKTSRADKFRQAADKVVFNLAVGGQGADIIVTAGNWNFVFGDNLQSIMDTNLGSLFSLMTQQFTASGMPATTFTFNPKDLPRQLKNKLLNKLANVSGDTTLGDIFGVDYTATGEIRSRTGKPVDGAQILKEMLEVIAEFGDKRLKTLTDALANPEKLLNALQAKLNLGKDAVSSFAQSHGLKEAAPAESTAATKSTSPATVNPAQGAVSPPPGAAALAQNSEQEKPAFGFNALNIPNLFTTLFDKDKQAEMRELASNLKDNLTADVLNMQQQTFDFLRTSGHLQGDGDLNFSLGNYNFTWGGDGKDLGAYLGDNNNFWGGRGDDVFYATGISNIFTGGEGSDTGVLMGRENTMNGGMGDDIAVVAGRINNVSLGAGNDQAFVFGEGGEITTGDGQDYAVVSGNYNCTDTGGDDDFAVIIGNDNRADLGTGNDHARVFGNHNKVSGNGGNDSIRLMGYSCIINGNEGDDHLMAAAVAKYSQLAGGEGNDLIGLGGYKNTFTGGSGIDSFVVSRDIIENTVADIGSDDFIRFNNVSWQDLWLQRSGSDLTILVNRKTGEATGLAQFESIGSVSFSGYFNGKRAKLVISPGGSTLQDAHSYTALSDNAVDALVNAMSAFPSVTEKEGFTGSLDIAKKDALATAWGDVSRGTSQIVMA